MKMCVKETKTKKTTSNSERQDEMRWDEMIKYKINHKRMLFNLIWKERLLKHEYINILWTCFIINIQQITSWWKMLINNNGYKRRNETKYFFCVRQLYSICWWNSPMNWFTFVSFNIKITTIYFYTSSYMFNVQ